MKIQKRIPVIFAVCLLLTAVSATSAGAVDAKSVTSGATVEIIKDGKVISTDSYDSPVSAWKAAFAAADNTKETVITLGTDWNEDTLMTVGSGMHMTIDLNGHYIRRVRNHQMKSDGEVFKVEKHAVFTVRDSNPRGEGYDGVRGGVITGGASGNAGGGVHIEEEGEFRLQGGTIYDCITDADGGAVNLEGSSMDTKFTMTGGRIYGCKTIDSANECYGGAIYMNKGTVSISNAKIDNCYSEDDGGAIYSERGTITLNNVVFSGNHCRERGGAIYTAHDILKYQATVVHAYDCVFAGNEANEDGGAVFINDNPEHDAAVLFHNCKFRNNIARKQAGAIFINDDNIALSGCEITGNSAVEEGGGVYVDGRYNITLKGKMIIKNNSSGKGQGVANLALQDQTHGTARIINAGLYKDSEVHVGSTSDKSVLLSEWMSQYQQQYFKADKGRLTTSDYRTVETKFVTSGSLFTEGGLYAVAILGGAGVIGTAALIIRQKKKKKMTQGGEEND